jgi:hypothetical protein
MSRRSGESTSCSEMEEEEGELGGSMLVAKTWSRWSDSARKVGGDKPSKVLSAGYGRVRRCVAVKLEWEAREVLGGRTSLPLGVES